MKKFLSSGSIAEQSVQKELLLMHKKAKASEDEAFAFLLFVSVSENYFPSMMTQRFLSFSANG